MQTQEQGKNGFHIIVDRKPNDWPTATITGLELKNLAGVDPNKYAVYEQVPGGHDLEIQNTQSVDLSKPGTERFFTGKKTTTEG